MLPREAPDDRRPAEPVARALSRLAILALAAGVIAGCGAEEPESPTTLPSTSVPSEIIVTLDPDGKGGEPAQETVVSCPDADSEACAAIAVLPEDPAAPVPPDAACTQIYGGGDTVTIAGRLNGEVVNAQLNRANGCEIDRFDRFTPLLEAAFPGYRPGAAATG